MDGAECTIRDARPTHDEGVAAARYMDMASEGGVRKALGGRFDEIIAVAFTEADHDLSYQNTILAERDGRVVGMVSGYTAEQHGRSSLAPLRRAPGSRFRRELGLAILGLIFRIMAGHEEGDFYIAFAGVDESLRGQGIGSLLLAAAEERARASGSRRLTLDVSARNDGAKRLYERVGMSVDYSWPRARFLPTIIHRMTKEL